MPKIEPVINKEEQIIGYQFNCPGCDHLHWFQTNMPGRLEWKFVNNDVNNPTFTPSLLNTGTYGPEKEKRVCHLFVKEGKIIYLDDCTHKLSGQTIDMEEISYISNEIIKPKKIELMAKETYKSVLEIVKKQNPGMPHKDAQKRASEIYSKLKVATESSGASDAASAGSKAGRLSFEAIAAIEKNVRDAGLDRHNIFGICYTALGNGELVKEKKAPDNVNTLVYFRDNKGNRVPYTGYFTIFI